ncbi:hypothetical protein AGDE_13053 [Angomonas deanei]|nr:hypothetical protein AGDE_13053 [Angomonas deanei]|eukprot:EPY23099.1 hypothetical protein AGDE_13053 [Angomonas deanei]
MQKRVADFLMKTSSPTSSQAGGAAKMIDLKELEVLLQDMLDYQEDIEQEAGTQLLIREMRFEDESRKLIQRAERAEHENKEMVKAMSKQALQKVQASKSPTASPPREGPPPVQETLHPRQHHDPTVAPSHVESAIPPPQYWRQPESQPTVTAGAANVTSPPHNADNRHVKVACPACTFEQNYGNVKCEICGTTLVFMTS